MKLSKDEIISKINEKVVDVDLAIELIEDVTDSFDSGSNENDLATIEQLKTELNEFKEKYKARFLTNTEEKEVKEDKEVPEYEEKNIIDVKEI